MTEAQGAVLAMLVGVAGTTTIHLSKGIMRLGLLRVRQPEYSKRRARLIYALGIAMNFTNPLWVIVANRFAPTVFYTSMYGLGLLPLLLFSRSRLAERLYPRQYVAAGVIVVGTLLIGMGNLLGGKPSLFGANRSVLVGVVIAWFVGMPLLVALLRRRPVAFQELLFGVAAGGMAALEAVMKGVSQAGATENTFLPQSPGSWWLFAVSFLGAAGAFAMIQWSYLRHCRASMMSSVYNVSYVATPLVLTAIIVPGASLHVWSIAGLLVISAGIVLISWLPARRPGTDTMPSSVQANED